MCLIFSFQNKYALLYNDFSLDIRVAFVPRISCVNRALVARVHHRSSSLCVRWTVCHAVCRLFCVVIVTGRFCIGFGRIDSCVYLLWSWFQLKLNDIFLAVQIMPIAQVFKLTYFDHFPIHFQSILKTSNQHSLDSFSIII